MATLVTVHGTYGNVTAGDATQPTPAADLQWWQPGSAFAADIQNLVEGRGGDSAGTPLAIMPFAWSGNNSEIERRAAGSQLLEQLDQLEARGEPYCVAGHSHGGSVIAAALVEAAGRGKPLDGLKGWITIGSPFVTLRRMPFLIARLGLTQRVMLVASMMLLFMFLFFVAGQVFGAKAPAAADTNTSAAAWFGGWRNVLAAVMMSVPTIIFTVAYEFIDHSRLFFYRKSTTERAERAFGAKWVSLCHANDEAVQGLRSLPRARIELFDPAFAAQRLALAAVFVLPIAYLIVISSPTIMVGIANFLKTRVYQVEKYTAVEQQFDALRKGYRQEADVARKQAAGAPVSRSTPEWTDIRRQREALKARFPDYVAIERALRFKREFLVEGGKPCARGELCGEGRSFAFNSRLLYHIVTDDLTSSLINDGTKFGIWSEAIRAAVPMLLVPATFILIALAMMLVIGAIARAASALLARILNRLTLAEIKREIFGNDTTGEIAVGAEPRPAWLPAGVPFLPDDLANPITDYANRATAASLAKFRNALSTLALTDGRPRDAGIVSSYLTWKELIHTTYFELPQFRKTFAKALAEADGFQPTRAFASDPDFPRAAEWLAGLRWRADRAASKPTSPVAAAR